MASIAAYNAGDPYEQLISQMVAMERRPQTALKKERGEQAVFKGVLSDFDSALSALSKSIKKIVDPLANPFSARAATVPENAGFTAKASDEATPGAHTLTVQRLATTDTRVSRRFETAGTELRAFFDTNGPQTFEVTVASPTADEPDRRVPLAVTVEPTGADDGAIMDEIRAAVASATSAAVEDETLAKREHGASVSVVNETKESTRLSLRSGGTGFDNRLSFTDSADGLLSFLGVNADAVASGTGGGQITAVGTTHEDSALNAKFALNGLTLYRSTNEVSDALPGVTLTLTATGEETSFSVGADSKATSKEVEDFIKQYNASLSFIERKSKIDAEKGTRGDLADDTAARGLRFGMRNDLVQDVPGQPAGMTRLTDLGIEIQNDGTLKLVNPQALQAAVERDPSAVQRLFAAEDGGFGTRLNDRLEAFLGNKGIVKARKDVTDARIKRLDARIQTWDERMAQREDVLRNQFAKLQETLALLQGQQQTMNNFFYGGY